VEELVAGGALSREDARNWPNNVITRAVGVAPDLELEVVTGPVASGDIFVLCSDGLTKHVHDGEILEQVTSRNAQASCEAMLDLALERGGTDNVSVVVIRVLPTVRRSSEPTNSPAMIHSGRQP
jgi:protein phosphatase